MYGYFTPITVVISSYHTTLSGVYMRIGLVLSGGFAKGAYQVGALKAINEFVPLSDIKCVSSASIGTPNAYAYINNRLDRIQGMWESICSNQSSTLITKILQSSLLQQDLRDLCEPDDKPEIPFYCAYWDISNLAKYSVCYKNLSKVESDMIPTYLKASVAFPIFNKSVPIGERRFFDGGFVDNIPVYPLIKHDLDYIICIYFDDIAYKFENPEFDSKTIKINFPNMSNIKNSFLINQNDVNTMIHEGYERTMHILRSIFANGYDDLEHIYKSIYYHNQMLGDPKLRLTTDVVITNVNKLLTRYSNRKNML